MVVGSLLLRRWDFLWLGGLLSVDCGRCRGGAPTGVGLVVLCWLLCFFCLWDVLLLGGLLRVVFSGWTGAGLVFPSFWLWLVRLVVLRLGWWCFDLAGGCCFDWGWAGVASTLAGGWCGFDLARGAAASSWLAAASTGVGLVWVCFGSHEGLAVGALRLRSWL